MKKTISLILTAMLLLSLAPAAFAEDAVVIECALGQEVSAYIGTIGASVTAYDNGFPSGLQLGAMQDAGGYALYVIGTPYTTGYYYASVMCTDGTVFHLELDIRNDASTGPVPQRPRIVSASNSAQCSLGADMTLSVEVENPGGYQIAYSWLKNGYLTGNGVENTCKVDSSASGIASYRCCMQFYANNSLNTMYSDEILIKVVDDHVDSLYINTLPYKMNYELGQQLDPDGISLAVVYADGSYDIVTDGYTVSPAQFNETGDVPVTLSYNGFSAGFNVSVVGKLEIQKITLSRPAEKSEYLVGEHFDPTDLSVRVHYSEDYSEVITDELSFSPEVFTEAGDQFVTVTYKDFTCRMKVYVTSAPVPAAVSVQDLPDKTEYEEDEELDITGLTLTLEYPDGSTKTISASENSAVSCSPTVLEEDGEQEITVTYTTEEGEKRSCKFSVQVNDDDDDGKSKKTDKKNKADKKDKAGKSEGTGIKGILSGKNSVMIAVIVALVAAGGVAAFLITKDIPLKDDLDEEEDEEQKNEDEDDSDF